MLVLCRWPYFRFMMIVLCSTCPGSLTMPSLFPSVPWALVSLLWWACDSLLLWLTHVNFGCAYLLWWLDWEVSLTGLAFESLSPVGCSVQGGYEEPAFLEEGSHREWILRACSLFPLEFSLFLLLTVTFKPLEGRGQLVGIVRLGSKCLHLLRLLPSPGESSYWAACYWRFSF